MLLLQSPEHSESKAIEPHIMFMDEGHASSMDK